MDSQSDKQIASAEIHAELVNGTKEEYELEDSSFMLPTSIDRAGLSRMINDMLQLETPVVFDILFNDEPLRTTLAEKLEQLKVQSETTIKLVYILAVTEPETEEIDSLNDWISGISYTPHLAHFATSCFDGTIALYTAEGFLKIAEYTTPSKSASAIALHSASDLGSTAQLVVGHVNGLMEVYSIDTGAKKPMPQLVASSQSDSDFITAVDIDPAGHWIASAGHGNIIYVYNNVAILETIKNTSTDDGKRKKRQIEDISLEPVIMFSKHKKPITSLKFVQLQEKGDVILLSASVDGQMAIWDVRSDTPLAIYACGRAITCLDMDTNCSDLYTGHEEGTVAIWELRVKSTGAPPKNFDDIANSTLTRKMSTCMFERSATAIRANTTHTNLFAAVALDGTAALLDKRFVKIPLQTATFKDHDGSDRCTGTCWVSTHELICATAAGKLHQIRFKELM